MKLKVKSLSSFLDDFLKNEDRVNKRFQTAASEGITIENVVLELNILLNHLELHGPAIILTNGSLLNCSECISIGDYLETCINSFFNRKQSYSGNYVYSAKLIFFTFFRHYSRIIWNSLGLRFFWYSLRFSFSYDIFIVIYFEFFCSFHPSFSYFQVIILYCAVWIGQRNWSTLKILQWEKVRIVFHFWKHS